MNQRNKLITISTLLSITILLSSFIFVFYLLSKPYINIAKNNSFEHSLDDWSFSKIGDSNLNLKNTAQSSIYNLNPDYLNKEIVFKYNPHNFSNNQSKSTIVFDFYNINSEITDRMTYVVGGDNDFGMYQNGTVNNISYATKIISSQIKINQFNDIKINILDDYNKLAGDNKLNLLNKNDVYSVKFSFLISSPEKEFLSVSYDGSFLDFTDFEKKDNYSFINTDSNFFKDSSKIYLTNYLPTDSKQYINICSEKGIRSEISQDFKLEKNKNYILLADVKTQTGRQSPVFEISNGKNVISDTANLYMSQTGWSTFGSVFNTDSKDYKISLLLDNKDNEIHYNCAGFDNIRVYKISLLEKLFPFILENKLKIKVNKNYTVKQSRINYNDIYTQDFKVALDNEYKEKIDIPIYDLYFNEDSFWNSNVKEEYAESVFVSDNNKYDAKIRIRGDTELHWSSPTKSWRVTFKDPKYFNKSQSINLIRPIGRGFIGDYYSYYLANKLNLIGLDNKFVFLRINDKPYGLMYEIEDWSSDILEKNKKPAGDLYGELNYENYSISGSTININEYKANIARGVFDWKKYSKSSYNSKNKSTNIFLLTELINNDLVSDYYKIVDTDNFIDSNIHAILSGSEHQDNIHNNRLYFNNTTGKFEMIPWDVRMNNYNAGPYNESFIGDILYNPFIDNVLRDSLYFNERNNKLFKYVSNNLNIGDDYLFYQESYNKVKDELFSLDQYDSNSDYIEKNINVEKEILDQDIKNHYKTIFNKINSKTLLKSYFTKNTSNNFNLEILSDDNKDFDLFNIKNIVLKDKNIKIYKDDKEINSNNINELLDSRFHYDTYINILPSSIDENTFEYVLKNISTKDREMLSSQYYFDKSKNIYFGINTIDIKNAYLIDIFKKFGIIPEYESAKYTLETPRYININNISNYIDFDIEKSSSKDKVSVEKILNKTSGDLELKDVFTSPKYELNKKLLNSDISIKYTPIKFIGDLSKSTLMFFFNNEDGIETNRLTYVLNGTGDHGMYQNSKVSDISFATKILSNTIKLNQENNLKLNILKDYNNIASQNKLSQLNKDDIASINFQFFSSCSTKNCIDVVYNKSFINLTNKTTQINKKDENLYVDDKFKDYIDLSHFNFDEYKNLDEFINKYPIFKKSNDLNYSLVIPKGIYEINKTIIVPENMPIKIEAGATLKFGDHISFISYSKIDAIGNENEKIVFTKLKNKKHWGSFAIINIGKEKSTLDNCVFEYGDKEYINEVYLSGMVDIYHSDADVINSTIQYAGQDGGDDGINLKNGLFSVKNNTFYKNGFDALDLDFADKNSYITDNKFIENGNDGIDLSGSDDIFINNNNILKSGDKCISVGENSKVFVNNNILNGCNFGIASKDKSSAYINNNKIINNNIGAAAYNKKEIFGGSILNISNTIFEDNKQDFGIEIIKQTDSVRYYDIQRYKSTCSIDANSKYEINPKQKVNEIIKEPKEQLKSKKQLLKLKIEDKMEDVGYKMTDLINTCEIK